MGQVAATPEGHLSVTGSVSGDVHDDFDDVRAAFRKQLARTTGGAAVPVRYDRIVGERFDAFLRTGRRFSFLIGHPLLLRTGLRFAVGTQGIANVTLQVMGNLVDSSTPGVGGVTMRAADRLLALADPVLRATRAAA